MYITTTLLEALEAHRHRKSSLLAVIITFSRPPDRRGWTVALFR